MTVSREDREKAIAAMEVGPGEHFAVEEAQLDALLELGWRPGGAPARPTREALADTIQPILWNGSNYPGKASVAILGQNIGPLRDKVVAALLAADHLWAEQPSSGDLRPGESVCPSCGQPRMWKAWGGGDGWRHRDNRPECPVAGPSAPVVDREALARAIHAAPVMIAWDRRDHEAIANHIIAVWMQKHDDEVRAEQRERDAQIAEGVLALTLAAAIRAGGAS